MTQTMPVSATTAALPVSGTARTVLFVDDEPQARKWFARLFSNEFVILTASSADEALQLLQLHDHTIAVLVTDYRMPGQDGLALLKAVQQLPGHRHLVRLLATAYAEKEVAVAAINQGRVSQILEKPFVDAEVRSALHEALEIYRQRERDHSLSESRAVAMRETLGFLAHELNTPLATALGYLEALKERHCTPSSDLSAAVPGMAQIAEKRPGDALAMIKAAERRASYALSLVATFVQSARAAYPGAVAAPMRASRLVGALLDEYPFEGDERAWVSCNLAADFELPGQRDLLYLVLCTITKNALIALHETPQPSLHISLECTTPSIGGSKRAAICFSDNGPGISPGILARLTHEPVTTRAAQGGNGMGLLFCRRVVQSMGGLVEVSSGPGPGATVTLIFKPETHLEEATP